jgi:hypothetical protein
MNDYIENLKQKPEHVRKRFAFTVAFVFTSIVFVGWVASYGLKSSPVLADKENKVEAPVSSLTASVSGLYADVKNIIFGSNKVEYSSDVFEIVGGNR